jgi:hypothetical protein
MGHADASRAPPTDRRGPRHALDKRTERVLTLRACLTPASGHETAAGDLRESARAGYAHPPPPSSPAGFDAGRRWLSVGRSGRPTGRIVRRLAPRPYFGPTCFPCPCFTSCVGASPHGRPVRPCRRRRSRSSPTSTETGWPARRATRPPSGSSWPRRADRWRTCAGRATAANTERPWRAGPRSRSTARSEAGDTRPAPSDQFSPCSRS